MDKKLVFAGIGLIAVIVLFFVFSPAPEKKGFDFEGIFADNDFNSGQLFLSVDSFEENLSAIQLESSLIEFEKSKNLSEEDLQKKDFLKKMICLDLNQGIVFEKAYAFYSMGLLDACQELPELDLINREFDSAVIEAKITNIKFSENSFGKTIDSNNLFDESMVFYNDLDDIILNCAIISDENLFIGISELLAEGFQ